MDVSGTDYSVSRSVSDVTVYLHEASGVSVWTQAIMLAPPDRKEVEVLFHYTTPEIFHRIAAAPFLTPGLWSDLELSCTKYGLCVYATSQEPAQLWSDGLRAHGLPSRPRGAEFASHCLPILVARDMATDMSEGLVGRNSKAPKSALSAEKAGARADELAQRTGLLWAIHAEAKEVLVKRAATNTEQRFRRIVQACEAESGAHHPDTLDTISYLAYLLDAKGAHAEAEPLYRRVLEGYRRQLGEHHTDTLRSMNNLAALLQAQGKFEEAEPLARAALQGSESTLGPDSADTATSVNNLAYLLKSLGRWEEAEALFRRMLQWREATYGTQHPDTLASAGVLAILLETQSKLYSAELFYRRALAGFEARQDAAGGGGSNLCAERPEVMELSARLAGLLHLQERLPEAEPLARRALRGREATLGLEHLETLESAYQLAHILHAQGLYGEAERLYRRVLRGRQAALGGEHSQTLTTATRLATLLESQHQLGEAEAIYRQSLQAHSANGSETDRVEVIRTLRSLGRVLVKQCNFGSAESVCRLLMNNCEEMYGLAHVDSLTSMHALAYVLDVQDKLRPAEDLYRRCLDGRETLLGASHPQSLETLNCLACLLNASGRLTESDPIFDKILTRRLRTQDPAAAAAVAAVAVALAAPAAAPNEPATPTAPPPPESGQATRGPTTPNTPRTADAESGGSTVFFIDPDPMPTNPSVEPSAVDAELGLSSESAALGQRRTSPGAKSVGVLRLWQRTSIWRIAVEGVAESGADPDAAGTEKDATVLQEREAGRRRPSAEAPASAPPGAAGDRLGHPPGGDARSAKQLRTSSSPSLSCWQAVVMLVCCGGRERLAKDRLVAAAPVTPFALVTSPPAEQQSAMVAVVVKAEERDGEEPELRKEVEARQEGDGREEAATRQEVGGEGRATDTADAADASFDDCYIVGEFEHVGRMTFVEVEV